MYVKGKDCPNVTLVLGGARSGKSVYAETLVEAAGPRRQYLATAEPFDGELSERIQRHRDRRGAGWDTIEEPLEIAPVIIGADRPLLVDCLTLWLSNLMHYEKDIPEKTDALVAALTEASAPVVLVSNEVGLSITPENALARRFMDAQGLLNQRIAAVVDQVVFVAAGLPLVLKGTASERGGP